MSRTFASREQRRQELLRTIAMQRREIVNTLERAREIQRRVSPAVGLAASGAARRWPWIVAATALSWYFTRRK